MEARLFFFIHGKDIVLTNGFLKKSDRVPKAEIEEAIRHRYAWLSATGGDEENEEKSR